MSFASAEYLPFLLLVALAFAFLPKRWRALGMLLASYGFYFGQPLIHFLILLASTLLDFGVGLALGRTKRQGARKSLLGLSLALNLGALVALKYSPLFTAPPHWHIALGISFYTFQTISYTIDVYQRRIEPCRNLIDYALYVTFFPQLIAGPIEKASHLLPQLKNLQPVNLPNLSLGGRLIIWGLFKKIYLADKFAPDVIQVLTLKGQRDSFTLLLCSYSILAIFYLDFSAYTDIARGTARLFGIDLVKNFRAPFAATSIGDFTRRWHVSLIRWIEEYLYMPLMRGRPTHFKIWRANLLLIALFGFWHGPYAIYALCGAMLGVGISIEQSLHLSRFNKGLKPKPKNKCMLVLGWFTAITLWSLFSVSLFSVKTSGALIFYRGLLEGGLPNAESLPVILKVLVLLLVGLGTHVAAAKLNMEALWKQTPSVLKVAAFITICVLISKQNDVLRRPFEYFRF